MGFSHKIFFILTSITSETSWGQTMDFSDLTEVSNFRWRCQLLYGVLFVELGWKLKHPETAISQWSLSDTPCILNWPKSPHRLGLRTKTKTKTRTRIKKFLLFILKLYYYLFQICSTTGSLQSTTNECFNWVWQLRNTQNRWPGLYCRNKCLYYCQMERCKDNNRFSSSKYNLHN